MAAKSRTARFYAKNSESRKKKYDYDKKRNESAKQREYRATLARERRARGLMGKGGADVSHTEGGGFRLEKPNVNRARNGHGKRRRLAPGRGTRKAG